LHILVDCRGERDKRGRTREEKEKGDDRDRDRDRDRGRDRDSSGAPRRESRSHSPPKNRGGTGRVMNSFRTFRRNYEGDASDKDLVQQSYEQYCTQFVMQTIDVFFEEHKNEEWFQERYNPLRQRELEVSVVGLMQSIKFIYYASHTVCD
jgi:hypothetical protein